MKFDHKGFTIVELLLLAVAVGLVSFAGWFVWSSNQQASSTLDQLADLASSSKSAGRSTKIVAVGDIACDPADKHFSGSNPSYCQSASTYAVLAFLKPSAILALGDLQYDDGAHSKFLSSYHTDWGKDKAKTYPSAGNHEYGTADAGGYFDYFSGRAGDKNKGYYSFSVGYWHAIVLNSNCDDIGGCGPGSAQYQWLKQDLEASKSACTLAFWHHPRFSSGRYSNDNNTTQRSASFWELLYQHRADLVLNGHDHLYERFGTQKPDSTADPAGIRQFTVGTGGKALYKKTAAQANSQLIIDDHFGVLSIDLFSKAYRWQFFSVNGTALDGGHQQCSI